MAEPSFNSPTSSETSTKAPAEDWQQAWLARRCLALGLTTPSPRVDPEEHWDAYSCELSYPNLEWRDRANDTPITARWLRRYYSGADKLHQLSMQASPFLRQLRAVSYAKLFESQVLQEIKFVPSWRPYSNPIRIPASELEDTRILWNT